MQRASRRAVTVVEEPVVGAACANCLLCRERRGLSMVFRGCEWSRKVVVWSSCGQISTLVRADFTAGAAGGDVRLIFSVIFPDIPNPSCFLSLRLSTSGLGSG